MKLKTLKDIEVRHKIFGLGSPKPMREMGYASSEELRASAIDDIKSFMPKEEIISEDEFIELQIKGILPMNLENTKENRKIGFFDPNCEANMTKIEYIKWKFNITEEDLK